MSNKQYKWKSIFGTLLIVFAIVFNWQWLFVAFFMFTIGDALYDGQIHFFETITRKEDSVLYYTQLVILLVSGVYYVSNLFK